MGDIELFVPTRRSVAQVKATIEAEIATRLPGGPIRRFCEGDVFRLVGNPSSDAHQRLVVGERMRLEGRGSLNPGGLNYVTLRLQDAMKRLKDVEAMAPPTNSGSK
jgi:hypothetical protein